MGVSKEETFYALPWSIDLNFSKSLGHIPHMLNFFLSVSVKDRRMGFDFLIIQSLTVFYFHGLPSRPITKDI